MLNWSKRREILKLRDRRIFKRDWSLSKQNTWRLKPRLMKELDRSCNRKNLNGSSSKQVKRSLRVTKMSSQLMMKKLTNRLDLKWSRRNWRETVYVKKGNFRKNKSLPKRRNQTKLMMSRLMKRQDLRWSKKSLKETGLGKREGFRKHNRRLKHRNQVVLNKMSRMINLSCLREIRAKKLNMN